MDLAETIEQLIDDNPDTIFSEHTIVTECNLDEEAQDNLRTVLNRLVKDNKLIKQAVPQKGRTVSLYFSPQLCNGQDASISVSATPAKIPVPAASTPKSFGNRRESLPGTRRPPVSTFTPPRGRDNVVRSPAGATASDLETKMAALQKEKAELLEEIEDLSKEYSEAELAVHIKMLHDYNEIKDVGQELLGRLAQLSQRTTREMYPVYDLQLDD